MPDNNVLHVGIDLGTSRSSICASNGSRKWVLSFIGWPKDFIAEKTLGKSVLCGKEALENRLSLDLYRPLEHGVIKEGVDRNEEAVAELVRHLISLVEPEEGQAIHAVVGVPADTLKVNKLAIKKALEDQVEALMVVSEPFAVAYGRDLLNNALTIDIGAGTVDFCSMHGTVPTEEDQKTILTAGDSIDEHLESALAESFPDAQFTTNIIRGFKEKYSFVNEPEGDIVVEMAVDGNLERHDITKEMKGACESILPAIIDTTAEMIARFDPEFQERIKKHVIVAGGGSQIKNIADAIGAGLEPLVGKCKVICVEDPLYAGSDGCLTLAQDMPKKYWDTM